VRRAAGTAALLTFPKKLSLATAPGLLTFLDVGFRLPSRYAVHRLALLHR
jgi:hypothetical protein